MVVDKHRIREQNRSLILEKIIQEVTVSRADLSKITNINKATVSEITKELLEKKLIHEIGVGASTKAGGRKPTMLKLNKKASLSVGIDLGANYIAVALFYLDGTMLYENIIRDIYINRTNVLAYIKSALDEVERLKFESLYGITGVTVAVHGIVYKNKIIFTSYYDLDQMDLYKEVKMICKYPLFIENEANLSALAESTFTSSHHNLVCLSVHSGIGVGIINNGKLYTGLKGMAGQIGHSILFPDGKQCRCGNRGCLELYCSEASILEELAKSHQLLVATPDIMKEYYDQGDSLAIELSKKMAKYLAIGINNIAVAYSPEIVYINSPIIRRIPEIIELIKNHLKSTFTENVIIRNSNLGSKAILHGACAIGIRKYLGITHLELKRETQLMSHL